MDSEKFDLPVGYQQRPVLRQRGTERQISPTAHREAETAKAHRG